MTRNSLYRNIDKLLKRKLLSCLSLYRMKRAVYVISDIDKVEFIYSKNFESGKIANDRTLPGKRINASERKKPLGRKSALEKKVD